VDLGGSSSPTYSVHSDKPYYHVKPATTLKSSSKYQGEDQYQNLDDVLPPIEFSSADKQPTTYYK
jgi:hypothetical protein